MTDRCELVNTCTHEVLKLFERARGWGKIQIEKAGAHSALGPRQLGALYSLRSGDEITPGDLAKRWMVTPAVITGVIDRLERQGLVRRVVDLEDRRRQLLKLTPAGETVRKDLEAGLLDDLARQLSLHSTTQLEELDRSLQLLEQTLSSLVERAREELEPAPAPEDETTEADASTAIGAPVKPDVVFVAAR